MTDSITKFPTRYRRPRQVRGREIYQQAEPEPEMVWEVCPYLRMHMEEDRCAQCPPWHQDPDYGTMQHGCYGLAAEVCRIVFAIQARKPL
jgi:hypothetical protein